MGGGGRAKGRAWAAWHGRVGAGDRRARARAACLVGHAPVARGALRVMVDPLPVRPCSIPPPPPRPPTIPQPSPMSPQRTPVVNMHALPFRLAAESAQLCGQAACPIGVDRAYWLVPIRGGRAAPVATSPLRVPAVPPRGLRLLLSWRADCTIRACKTHSLGMRPVRQGEQQQRMDMTRGVINCLLRLIVDRMRVYLNEEISP